MADFQNNNNVAQAARVTGSRDLVTLPSYYKWLAQGKIFEAGQSLQSDGIDSQGEATLTPDDVKATFALQAPSGKTPLILPLFLKVSWEVEGGAATDFQLIFTRAAPVMGVSLTMSGRDMVAQNCMYAANPIAGSPKAKALYGVATTFLLTVSALDTANDCVMDEFAALVDNNVSVPVAGSLRVWQRNFMREAIPHILTSGAAMIYYISSATSDAKIHPYMQWAELDEEDLI